MEMLTNLVEPNREVRGRAQFREVPAMSSTQLLQLHTELITYAEHKPSKTKTALTVASIVRTVIRNLHGGSDASTGISAGSSAHNALVSGITALRINPSYPTDIRHYLDLADGWAADMSIHVDTVLATAPTDPWGHQVR